MIEMLLLLITGFLSVFFLVDLFFSCPWIGSLKVYLMKKGSLFHQRAKSEKVIDQWPDALLLLAGALKAGLNSHQAVELLFRETPPPLGLSLRKLMGQEGEWLPYEQKVRLLFSDPFLSSVQGLLLMSQQTGGKTASLLKRMALHLRKDLEMKEKVKVLTLQGKWTAWVVGLSPFGFLFLMSIFSPDLFKPLFETKAGWILLGGVVVMVGIGLIVVYRLARVDLS
ncbi:hypothetical protein BVX98_07680 [bacterium F11]|nr:hypothetical protein BVX98_07680 [bacterium F11]